MLVNDNPSYINTKKEMSRGMNMSRMSQGDYEIGPFEDDYRGFEVREDDSARGPLILALAIGVLLVFGAVVWNTYRQGVRKDAALPVIIADSEPYKQAVNVAPTENEDTKQLFYDDMDGSDRSEVTIASARLEDEALAGGPPAELAPPTAQETKSDAISEQIAALKETGVPDKPPAGPPVASLGNMPVAATKPAAPAEVSPESAFAFTDSGHYLVQIAAFRSQDAAESAWNKVNRSKPELYRGAGKFVQRADLGAKGVFYRLRVGAFDQRSEATAFCDALKAAGDNCIVVSG